MSTIRRRLVPGVLVLGAIAILVATLSCQRLDPEPAGPLPTFRDSPFTDGIPAEFGRLVAAVPHDNGRWISLWFEKPDQSVVGVWLSSRNGAVGRTVEIPRK